MVRFLLVFRSVRSNRLLEQAAVTAPATADAWNRMLADRPNQWDAHLQRSRMAAGVLERIGVKRA